MFGSKPRRIALGVAHYVPSAIESPQMGALAECNFLLQSGEHDGNNVSYQVERVLLTSAFEHLLKARPDYDDVATKFSDALPVSKNILASAQRRCAYRGRRVIPITAKAKVDELDTYTREMP